MTVRVQPSEAEVRALAVAHYGNDDVQIDDDAVVSRAGDGTETGAFVAAWVWVEWDAVKAWPRSLHTIPRRFVWDKYGNPLASGPACASCGALAAFGTHPACGRVDGSVLACKPRDMPDDE